MCEQLERDIRWGYHIIRKFDAARRKLMNTPDNLKIEDVDGDTMELEAAQTPNDCGHIAIFAAIDGDHCETNTVRVGLTQESLTKVRNWASALLCVVDGSIRDPDLKQEIAEAKAECAALPTEIGYLQELGEWSGVCGLGRMSLEDSRDYVESLHQSGRTQGGRIETLEDGIRSLRYYRNMGDLAREEPGKHGGYQGASHYDACFEELLVELVGPPEPEPNEPLPIADVVLAQISVMRNNIYPCKQHRRLSS